MRRAWLLVALACCSTNPKAGAERTIAALGIKPDGVICEAAGCDADTCTLRFGERVERWDCNSDMCAPARPKRDPPPQTVVIPVGK